MHLQIETLGMMNFKASGQLQHLLLSIIKIVGKLLRLSMALNMSNELKK